MVGALIAVGCTQAASTPTPSLTPAAGSTLGQRLAALDFWAGQMAALADDATGALVGAQPSRPDWTVARCDALAAASTTTLETLLPQPEPDLDVDLKTWLEFLVQAETGCRESDEEAFLDASAGAILSLRVLSEGVTLLREALAQADLGEPVLPAADADLFAPIETYEDTEPVDGVARTLRVLLAQSGPGGAFARWAARQLLLDGIDVATVVVADIGPVHFGNQAVVDAIVDELVRGLSGEVELRRFGDVTTMTGKAEIGPIYVGSWQRDAERVWLVLSRDPLVFDDVVSRIIKATE